MSAKLPATLARSTKRTRGRTELEQTPVAIRSTIPISHAVETRMRRKLARRIGHAAPLVERGTIRFEDINGPRGGIDTVCRIKLVLSGRPSVVVSDRGRYAEPTFDRASFKVQHALQRVRGKQRERAPMKVKTARRPPSRKAITAKARRAKHRVGVQRARRGR